VTQPPDGVPQDLPGRDRGLPHAPQLSAAPRSTTRPSETTPQGTRPPEPHDNPPHQMDQPNERARSANFGHNTNRGFGLQPGTHRWTIKAPGRRTHRGNLSDLAFSLKQAGQTTVGTPLSHNNMGMPGWSTNRIRVLLQPSDTRGSPNGVMVDMLRNESAA
jgi:hypothetical protein